MTYRTDNLQSFILYIYATNIGTEYFKHGIYSRTHRFSSSKCSLFHNSNVFGSWIILIVYTGVLKLKKNNSGTKRLKLERQLDSSVYLSELDHKHTKFCCRSTFRHVTTF